MKLADKQVPNTIVTTKEITSDNKENISACETEELTLPALAGKVAKFLANTTMVNQKAQATELYKFLSKENQDLSKLNADNRALAALLCLPNSGLTKVVYSIGYGCSEIDRSKDIDGKLLALTSEGGDNFGYPQPLVLNKAIATDKAILSPPNNIFAEKEAADDTWPMFQAS
eukprot:2443086-Ditylum_brightwellii.AAC.6